MKIFTIEDIRSWKPCYDPGRHLPEGWSGTAADFLKLDTIPPKDRLWVVLREDVLDAKILRLFAVWCARQVQHLLTDDRSKQAIEVAERFANGQATDEELAAVRVAAWYAWTAVVERGAPWDAWTAAAADARGAAAAARGAAAAARGAAAAADARGVAAAAAAWAVADAARAVARAAWLAANDAAAAAAPWASTAWDSAWAAQVVHLIKMLEEK